LAGFQPDQPIGEAASLGGEELENLDELCCTTYIVSNSPAGEHQEAAHLICQNEEQLKVLKNMITSIMTAKNVTLPYFFYIIISDKIFML
jgi:hypothetical protein